MPIHVRNKPVTARLPAAATARAARGSSGGPTNCREPAKGGCVISSGICCQLVKSPPHINTLYEWLPPLPDFMATAIAAGLLTLAAEPISPRPPPHGDGPVTVWGRSAKRCMGVGEGGMGVCLTTTY